MRPFPASFRQRWIRYILSFAELFFIASGVVPSHAASSRLGNRQEGALPRQTSAGQYDKAIFQNPIRKLLTDASSRVARTRSDAAFAWRTNTCA